MDRKYRMFFFFGLTFTVLAAFLAISFAAVSVGVKKGDWIEYTVATTGTATQGHDVVSARIEITDVQGVLITVKIDSTDSSGEQDSDTVTLNLENGHLGDQFIIPANLNVGETFLDENLGNVTISGSEERVVAGAERTLLYATEEQRSVYWDKSTGILTEGQYSTAGFTMTTKLDQTNIWQPDNTVYVLLAVALLLLGLALVVFAIRRRKKTARRVQT
jgi:hypothetical protein